ncbi:MAG: hypothetical protein DSY87_04965 [Methylococcus sp.]|nr:MAG: hypothetical protein DSY87_04965 [Methylococcus sp.]
METTSVIDRPEQALVAFSVRFSCGSTFVGASGPVSKGMDGNTIGIEDASGGYKTRHLFRTNLRRSGWPLEQSLAILFYRFHGQ